MKSDSKKQKMSGKETPLKKEKREIKTRWGTSSVGRAYRLHR